MTGAGGRRRGRGWIYPIQQELEGPAAILIVDQHYDGQAEVRQYRRAGTVAASLRVLQAGLSLSLACRLWGAISRIGEGSADGEGSHARPERFGNGCAARRYSRTVWSGRKSNGVLYSGGSNLGADLKNVC